MDRSSGIRSQRSSRRALGAATIALVSTATLTVPRVTHASPLFEMSGGLGGQGGFNARATESGAASTYFNPSMLVFADPGITLGIVILTDQIGITVGPRSHTQDVPDGLENAQHADGTRFGSYPIGTGVLQNGVPASGGSPGLAARPRQGAGSGQDTFAYQLIGLVEPLFQGRVVLGIYSMVPYAEFTGASSFYSDEREQYFTNSLHPEMYSDRMTATSIAFGGGFKVTDELALGLSFTLALKTGATTPTYVADAGQFQNILVDSKVTVNAKVAPHFGLSWQPADRWHFSATVHTAQKLEIDTKFTFLLANGVEQAASVSFTHDYVPWSASVGTQWDAYRTESMSLSVVSTFLYQEWSDYIDRHSEAPISQYAWFNTLTPSIGIRLKKDVIRAYLDLNYVPSPVPAQTGRSNYVDNDRVGTSLGMDYQFELFGAKWRVGGQLQLDRLIPKTTQKIITPTQADGQNHYPWLVTDEVPDDAVINGTPVAGRNGLQTNNPGFPGFSSEGWVYGGGLYFSVAP
ncbi:MAG: hypothetical protein ACHREM_10780 [Polyangiales bacterium]